MLLTAGLLSRFYVSSREETIVGKVARLLLDGEVRAVSQLAVHPCESLSRKEIFVPAAAGEGVTPTPRSGGEWVRRPERRRRPATPSS